MADAMASSLLDLYSQLKSLARTADYRDNNIVLSLARKLRSAVGSRRDLLAIKSLVLLSEVYDYYGRFRASEGVARSGKNILPESPRRRIRRDELGQAKVRLAVAYAGNLYRQDKYDEAEQRLLACRTYVIEHIRNDNFPNFGTLGEIAYTLGRIHRQRQRFLSALRELNAAVELYNDRILLKRRKQKRNLEAEEAFSTHKVATIVALAISWCNFARGSLATALFGNLIPSQMLLRNSGDVLNSAYADVVYSSISRAHAGGDKRKLLSLRDLVNEAHTVFINYKHLYYAAGAALELALVALALGDIEGAATQLKEIRTLSSSRDIRWVGSALIIESRILRHKKRYSDAARVATRAVQLAEKNHERLTRIDALIARSEAYAAADKKHGRAVGDFLEALNLNATADGTASPSPKVHGLAHLHLVQHYLAMKRIPDALASFAEWEKVHNEVEHSSLHQLAARLAPKLEPQGKLLIDINQPTGLNIKGNVAVLRGFLLRQATIRSRTNAEVVERLGISRQALSKWRNKLEKSPLQAVL
jgi:tetratricopeptide (TPR) repeat protein